jgi:hypothetical protein
MEAINQGEAIDQMREKLAGLTLDDQPTSDIEAVTLDEAVEKELAVAPEGTTEAGWEKHDPSTEPVVTPEPPPSPILGINDAMPSEQVQQQQQDFHQRYQVELEGVKSRAQEIAAFRQQAQAFRESQPGEYAARITEANQAEAALRQHAAQIDGLRTKAEEETNTYSRNQSASTYKRITADHPWLEDSTNREPFYRYLEHDRGLTPQEIGNIRDEKQVRALVELYETQKGLNLPRRANGHFAPRKKATVTNLPTKATLGEATQLLSARLRGES